MPNTKSEQMFCSWTTGVEDPTSLREIDQITPGWTTGQPSAKPTTMFDTCARLWLVALRGVEVYRVSNLPVEPLSRSVIENGPLPVGAVRSDNVRAYRVRVKCSTEAGYAVFDLDLNQEVEFWAHRIEVTLMGPANALSIPSNNPPGAITRNNLVVDTLLGCQLIPIETSRGCCTGRLTTYTRSPENTQTIVPVPRSAKSVKIYQGEPVTAAPSIRWARQIGAAPLTPVINVGGINFSARESIDASSEIGIETHLVTDVDPVNPRLFIMNWTIKP